MKIHSLIKVLIKFVVIPTVAVQCLEEAYNIKSDEDISGLDCGKSLIDIFNDGLKVYYFNLQIIFNCAKFINGIGTWKDFYTFFCLSFDTPQSTKHQYLLLCYIPRGIRKWKGGKLLSKYACFSKPF